LCKVDALEPILVEGVVLPLKLWRLGSIKPYLTSAPAVAATSVQIDTTCTGVATIHRLCVPNLSCRLCVAIPPRSGPDIRKLVQSKQQYASLQHATRSAANIQCLRRLRPEGQCEQLHARNPTGEQSNLLLALLLRAKPLDCQAKNNMEHYKNA
jgi:hypothetical protein